MESSVIVKSSEERVREIAAIYNPGNVDFLVSKILPRVDHTVPDDRIHDLAYYYEEEYHGDCWEEICFGTSNEDEY